MEIEKLVQDVTTQLSRPVTFLLSDEFEANMRLDNVAQWPVVLFVQGVKADVQMSMSEVITAKYDMLIMFLDKLEGGTLDALAEEKSEKRKKMELLCYEFFLKLSRRPEYTRSNNKGIKATVNQVTERFDVYVSGVAAQTQMNFEFHLPCDNRP
jgi:hypothetical protein